MSNEEWEKLSLRVGQIFTPATPVDKKALFAGRIIQTRKVIDACNLPGQHAILFGERGVGKTSLANTLSETLIMKDEKSTLSLLAPRVNCVGSDTYTDIWKKIFKLIEIKSKTNKIGFGNNVDIITTNIEEFYERENISPDDVLQTLMLLSEKNIMVLIIDEFDRIADKKTKTSIADTIKTLSDHAIAATIILVGVADSIEELIEEHYSIERALVQIQMPRMSKEELYEIVDKGLNELGMTINEKAKKDIAVFSLGLPHYTHLLGLHATRHAIDLRRKEISPDDVEAAIAKALDEAQQTIKNSYYKATTGTRSGNIYPQVLLACALANTDDIGCFTAADVRSPLSNIMKKPYEIPSFSRHLHDFCEESKGSILKKRGKKHLYKFRFRNPLMQPYVTMHGIADKLIDV